MDFGAAVATYQAAAWVVINDLAIWTEEERRQDAPRLAWPPALPPTQAQRFFRMLALADVDVLLVLLKSTDDPRSPAWPPTEADPRMQVLLRVVVRSMVAGEAAVVATFGGVRITGKREYQNRVNEQWVDLALQVANRSGLTREQAFDLFEVPRRKAFRARKRGLSRKK